MGCRCSRDPAGLSLDVSRERRRQQRLQVHRHKSLAVEDVMRALQAILIAGAEGEEMIRSGDKGCTFRMGERDYSPGPVILCCHIYNWAAMGQITDVMVARLDTLSPQQLAENGYKSTEDAVDSLKTYYPSIKPESDVTVVFFKINEEPAEDVEPAADANKEEEEVEGAELP